MTAEALAIEVQRMRDIAERLETLLIQPGESVDALRTENERLLALLRQHPPPRPSMLPQRRLRLAAAQQWRCALCRELLNEAFHADHRTPWSSTFDDGDANIDILCVPCHLSKSSVEQSIRRRKCET